MLVKIIFCSATRGKPTTEMLYILTAIETANGHNGLTGTFNVNSIPTHVLFDSGALYDFISIFFVAY